jgi:hypothetical protein
LRLQEAVEIERKRRAGGGAGHPPFFGFSRSRFSAFEAFEPSLLLLLLLFEPLQEFMWVRPPILLLLSTPPH